MEPAAPIAPHEPRPVEQQGVRDSRIQVECLQERPAVGHEVRIGDPELFQETGDEGSASFVDRDTDNGELVGDGGFKFPVTMSSKDPNRPLCVDCLGTF